MNDGTNAASGRTDVHHHVVPPQYAAFLARRCLGEVGVRAIPKWTLDDAAPVRGVNQVLSRAGGEPSSKPRSWRRPGLS
jgi:hypothetical protein